MHIYNDITRVNTERLENEYYIYVLENSNHAIKVGISHNIHYRVRSLSGSNAGGNRLTRCAISEPTWLYSLEKTIHRHFDDYRIKGTEWFRGITFEQVVEYIDYLFSKEEYTRCNAVRHAATLGIPIEEVLNFEEQEYEYDREF